MFAKYIDGYIRTAKEQFKTEEEYIAAGYKRVIFSEMPEAPSGYSYAPGWEEQENAIVQTWTLQELPDDVTAEEIAAAIEEALA